MESKEIVDFIRFVSLLLLINSNFNSCIEDDVKVKILQGDIIYKVWD